MSTPKPEQEQTSPSEFINSEKLAITAKPANSSAPTPEISAIDLGVITFRELVEIMRNPPAETIGFDIAPEDEELFRRFLNSPPAQ